MPQAHACTLIQRLLENAQAEVQAASSSATEWLQLLVDFQPVVIVSDIGTLGMDGYRFIRAIRNRPVASGGRTPTVAQA